MCQHGNTSVSRYIRASQTTASAAPAPLAEPLMSEQRRAVLRAKIDLGCAHGRCPLRLCVARLARSRQRDRAVNVVHGDREPVASGELNELARRSRKDRLPFIKERDVGLCAAKRVGHLVLGGPQPLPDCLENDFSGVISGAHVASIKACLELIKENL